MRAALAACCVLTLVVAGCSRAASDAHPVAGSRPAADPAAVTFAEGLRQRVTTDAMVGHLQRLEEIAARNGNNRAAGTPGYDASVDYVAKALRDSTKTSVASGSPCPRHSTRCFSRTVSESPSAIGLPSTGSAVRTSPKPEVWS